MEWLDRTKMLWLSMLSFAAFSLGSGVLAGYVAGRLNELGRYAVGTAVLGLASFFLLLIAYTVYLRMFARMPGDWTGPLMWGLYPGMVAAVILGWKGAKKERPSSTPRPK